MAWGQGTLRRLGAEDENEDGRPTMSERPFVVVPKVMVRGPSGRYLFLRRSAMCKNFVGKWEMPGGKMEPGETLDQCLARETEEESGLRIRVTGVMGASEGEIAKFRLAYLILEGVADTESVQLSSEHDQYVWVTLSQAAKLDLCPAFVSLSAALAEKAGHRVS